MCVCCKIRSHLFCRLSHVLCYRLANLHHAYATIDCYCSSHHVHHFSVLSPGLLGGKDTESSGFEEHTWEICNILMEQTDSAVKKSQKARF